MAPVEADAPAEPARSKIAAVLAEAIGLLVSCSNCAWGAYALMSVLFVSMLRSQVMLTFHRGPCECESHGQVTSVFKELGLMHNWGTHIADNTHTK